MSRSTAAKARLALFVSTLLLGFSYPSFADPITFAAAASSAIPLSPSSDTLTVNATSGSAISGSTPFAFQTATFSIGDSEIPDQIIAFAFQDTININGVTRTVNIAGQDAITTTADTLSIFAGAPIIFGKEVFTVQALNLSGYNIGNLPLQLQATVAPTPEPASLLLCATGILGGVAASMHGSHSRGGLRTAYPR